MEFKIDIYSFAASNVSVGLIEDSNKNASISYLPLKKENIKALIEFYEKQSKNDKIKLNKEKLNELMVALNEYMENTGDKGEEIGGVLAINYALVELQFALGLEFASLYF
jgi:hypothetical protein